jgi:putative ubiquitin-RnfH superfamily antitoxin RatB of RatAB toxin-antitoxin module
MADDLCVEVVAALPDRQILLTLRLPAGATVADALERADLHRQLPDFPVDLDRVGVFGKKCDLARPLSNGDRVELYRPLRADPKEVRRQLASLERSDDRTE